MCTTGPKFNQNIWTYDLGKDEWTISFKWSRASLVGCLIPIRNKQNTFIKEMLQAISSPNLFIICLHFIIWSFLHFHHIVTRPESNLKVIQEVSKFILCSFEPNFLAACFFTNYCIYKLTERGHLPEHLPSLPRRLRHSSHQRESGRTSKHLEARRDLCRPQRVRQWAVRWANLKFIQKWTPVH